MHSADFQRKNNTKNKERRRFGRTRSNCMLVMAEIITVSRSITV